MIKNLRYLFVALLAIFSLNASAGSIVFADLGLENGKQYSSFDGGDFTVTFAGGGNDGKYYDAGTGIRVYGNGSMAIAAKEGTINKIVITYDGTNKPNDASVVSVGTYDVAGGYWTGDAAEVTFTRPSGTGHWRVKSIAVNDAAVIPDVPTEGQTPETAITVARALEIIAGLEKGKSTDFTYYVKGIATSDVEINYSSATFTLGDTQDAANVLKAYNLKGIGNKDASSNILKKGDTVVIFGTLMKYEKTDVEPAEIIPEITSGYVVSVNGSTDGPVIQDITVAQALELIAGLENGATTSDTYNVKGFIVGGDPTFDRKTEDQTLYGNTTFTIANEKGGANTLTVYRCKYFANKNFTEDDINALKDGDEVVIQGNLQKYEKYGAITPELKNSFVISINGVSASISNVKNEAAKGVIYNMAGQRVMNAQKGLYIMNGKKYLVK